MHPAGGYSYSRQTIDTHESLHIILCLEAQPSFDLGAL